MPVFEFQGMDNSGAEVEDTIEASSQSEAAERIRGMGYFVTKLQQVASGPIAAGTCPACGQANSAGAERCDECGAWLSSDDAQRKFDERHPAGDEDRDTEEPDPDTLESRLLTLLRGGQKIAAIKAYREETGAGLKDAKDSVEALARVHGIESQRATGCTGMLVLMLAAAFVLVRYLF